MTIHGERIAQAKDILVKFLKERGIKISYPTAISFIASNMGVREETARKYLDDMLLNYKELKTNYWEIWVEEI